MIPAIKRWIDIGGPEWNRLPNPKGGLRFIDRALKCKAIYADKNGRLFGTRNDGTPMPINDELDGELVGLRYPKFAAN